MHSITAVYGGDLNFNGSASPVLTQTVNQASTLYSIGGRLIGPPVGSAVTLLDNGTDALAVRANGQFTFATRLASGATYNVTVSTQPKGETCKVINGSGAVGSANVTNVVVSCTRVPTYTIGGTVKGLSGGAVTLLDNGGNAQTITTNRAFTFTTRLATGATYDVTVGTQPVDQICKVTRGTGTVKSANVTNVAVTCTGAAVAGLTSGASVTSG
jgi:trimeric autotransporter adhesin